MFSNPDSDALRALLGSVRILAVAGLSPDASRPSHRVAARLQSFGYRIVPVRPGVTEILGEPAWERLADIPFAVDIAVVFRAPAHVDEVVSDCIAADIPRLWLQDGVVNESAALRAQAAGLTVVMDRCMLRDYLHLMP